MKTIICVLLVLYLIFASFVYALMSAFTNNVNSGPFDQIKLFLIALIMPFVLVYVNFFKKSPSLPSEIEDSESKEKKNRRKK